jgi:putative peptide zinc metalloprotease protein
VFVAKWNVLGPDIPLFYDFSKKTFGDLAEFWLLLMVVGFVHESAHGLTCKHYGGEVHSMGLMFLYLTPCFYVDVTESWVSATRMQRLATIIAGIWVELILCGMATLVWVSTQPGEWLHDFCYKVILITGIAVVVVNMNPLIKLDGYYFLTEFVRVPDLKERSTSFLVGWVQRYLFRLPVEVPVVSRRRLPLFVLYALASGAYSYLLLFLFIRFSYNVCYHWLAELAVLPAALVALWIFRGRLRSLQTFTMNFFRIHAAEGVFRPTPLKLAGVVLLLGVLFVPILRDRENAWFVIEPGDSHQVYAGVTGRVEAVYAREGDAVRTGQVLARLESLSQAATSEKAAAALSRSQAEVFTAELHHSGLGPALAEQHAAEGSSAIAEEERAMLAVTAPASGVVTTAEPQNLVHRNVTDGEVLLTIVDPKRLVARLYIPSSEMQWVRPGDEISLQPSSQFGEIRGRLGAMEGAAVTLPAGLVSGQEFKGLVLPAFYTTRMALREQDDRVQPGMSGPAKIFGRRRSVAERVATTVGNMLHTHFW